MKSVFLIGDSIREGFCETTKRALEGYAEVYYPRENCQFTQYTYVHLPEWASQCDPEKVDLVYWNNGHWDTAHWMRDDDDGPLNTPEEYARMLRRLIKRISNIFPNAKIVFFTTTHREEGAEMIHPRSNPEISAYNAAARVVMDEAGIPVSNLAAFADKNAEEPVFADGVHFTKANFEKLGLFAAEEIRAALEK